MTSSNRNDLPRLASRILPLALLLLLFGAFAHCQESALPPQGIYEGCAPGATPEACDARLVAIREAGFRYVLNYSTWYGSPSQVVEYAETANALGLQLIWPLNNPAWIGQGRLAKTYSRFAGRRMSNRRFLPYAIGLVANLPATWGFYIGDETEAEPEDIAAVGALSAQLRSLAPQGKQLFISRPGEHQLWPFLGFPDVAGTDVYPIGSGDPTVSRTARRTREMTTATGVGTVIVLQAFAWSEYDPLMEPAFPSEEQMRAMRDAAVRIADPSMILWYSYQDIVRSDDPQSHWEDLKRAAFSPIKGACEPSGRKWGSGGR